MCGRYTLTTPKGRLAEEFGLSGELPEIPPSYNVAPAQDVATILGDGEERRLEMMRWGLIPSWADDPEIGARMINARSETAAEKTLFPCRIQETPLPDPYRRILRVAENKRPKTTFPHPLAR